MTEKPAAPQKSDVNDERNWVEFFDSTGQSLFVNVITRGTFLREDIELEKRADRARRDSAVFLEAWQKEQEKERALSKQRANQSSQELEVDDDDEVSDLSPEKVHATLQRIQTQLARLLKAPLYDRHKFPLERSHMILEGVVSPLSIRDDADRSTKRRAVFTNLCALEVTIIDQTQAVLDQFFDVLFSASGLKTFGTVGREPVVRALAVQIQQLGEFHSKFLAELRQRTENWTAQTKIGDLILTWGPQFRLHAQYAKDYPEARLIMERAAAASVMFGKHFKDAKFAQTSAESMLDSPLFHLARVHLLISKMFGLTNRSHPDYSDLEKCVRMCIAAQEDVNEAEWMSSASNKAALAALAQQFDAPLELGTHPRKMIKEDRLCVMNPTSGPKFFHFHLLSDALLYSTFLDERPGVPTKLSLARAFDLSQLSIVRPITPQQSTRSLVSPTGQAFPMSSKTSFQLGYNDRVIVVQTRSQHEKRAWVGAIRHAIEHAKIRTEKAPSVAVWTNNTATNRCMLCQKEFSMTRRRHHCRSCGKLVCDPCSNQRKLISHVSPTPVRVCKGCADPDASNSLLPVEGEGSSDESVDGSERSVSRSSSVRRLQPSSPPRSPPRSIRELTVVNISKPKFALDMDSTHEMLIQQDVHYALVHELIASEQEYVADLEICFAFVVKPLLAAPEIIPGASRARPMAHSRGPSLAKHEAEAAKLSEEEIKELRDLLGLIQPIYTQNLVLLTRLIEKSSSSCWTSTSHVNGLFANNSSAFASYVVYAQSYGRIEPTLAKIPNVVGNIDRQSVLREKSTREKPYTVRSLLKFPTMRIAQYIWYFQQLVDAGATVYAASLAEMQRHNSTLVNTESKDKLTKLEARFAGGKVVLAKDSRMLVKEGILTRITRRGMRSFYFHLFNDLLLYSDVLKNGTYNLHHSFELHFVSVVEPIGCPQPFALQINSPQKSFVIVCDSKDDKAAWEANLHQCIAETKKINGENNGNGLVAPVWTQDHLSTCCVLCQSAFTAIKRRHHCRACGILVCNQCSRTRQLLPNVDKNAVRICDSCTHLNSGLR